MICPCCGKLNHTGCSNCLFCGAPALSGRTPYQGRALVELSSQEGPEECVYDMGETTGYEWCCEIHERTGASPAGASDSLDRRILAVGDVDASAWRDESVPKRTPEVLSGSCAVSGVTLPAGKVGPEPSGTEHSPLDSHDICSAEKKISPRNTDHSLSDEDILRSELRETHEIVRKIGTGGMASVYLARETALDREVAIKLLPRHLLRDEQFIVRFRREAVLSAMLEHPNIVRIYRVFEEPGIFFFIMNYIPGGTLSERLKSGRVQSIRDIVRWSRDICSALSYAHEHGVVHRDLKPDNILLDSNGRAIVTDFGIAHAAENTGLTRTGAVIGTPQYMSPDQACGKISDARSDIYSLGMVLYQLTTGTLPFKADDPVSLMYMHVHKIPVSPERCNPAIPRWLSEIIMRCLAKKPDDRFRSTRDLQAALLEGYSPRVRADRESSRVEVGKKVKSSLLEAALSAFTSALSSNRGSCDSSAHRPPLPSSNTKHALKLPRDLALSSPENLSIHGSSRLP